MRDAAQALGQGDDRRAGSRAAEGDRGAAEGRPRDGPGDGAAVRSQPGQDGSEQDGDSDGPMGLTLQDGQGDEPGHGYRPGRRRAARESGRDPLGRRYGQGSSGADESGDVTVPEERERQRTQAIQEELRRRGAERARPQQELDYIDRLLKQF